MYAPNGVDPISTAVIWIPLTGEPVLDIAPGVACDRCPIGGTRFRATSATDGTFVLTTGAAGGDYEVVVQNGRFRRVVTVHVDPCGRAAGSRAAVESSALGAVLLSRAMLDQYNLVFAGCGSLGGGRADALQSPTVLASVSSWMTIVGALRVDGRVDLTQFRDPWGAVDTVPIGTRNWVHGDVQWHVPVGMTTAAADHPLTIQRPVPDASGATCGQAFFSSYHTSSSTTATTLSAQERLLEYLIFQLAKCNG